MRLLLVEDNVPLAENLKEVFQDAGYTVDLAASARTALEIAGRNGFELGVFDVRLPDMSGTTLLKQLRPLSEGAEVVIVTANADLDSAVEALAGGAFAYLTKPVRIEELLLTVSRAKDRVELKRRSIELKDALERSEQTLRTIVNTIDAVVLAVDESLNVRFANEGTLHVLGYTPEEMVGRKVQDVLSVTSEEREDCEAYLRSVFGGSASPSKETVCRTKDNQTRLIDWRWSRSHVEAMAYGVGADITQRRELERRMKASEKLAVAGTLTAGVAHEIKNPLNAAILQLSLLERLVKRGSEGQQKTLQAPIGLVRSELRRLDALLEDFLSFARPRSYQSAPVDLSEVVRRSVRLQEEAPCEIATEITAGIVVRGDADALSQVLVNLLKNAIEAADERVEVVLTLDGGEAVLEISNDGAIVTEDLLSKIFVPFFTTKPGGTGLGLPIVYTIVDAHDGTIHLAPTPQGTRAIIRLPVLRTSTLPPPR